MAGNKKTKTSARSPDKTNEQNGKNTPTGSATLQKKEKEKAKQGKSTKQEPTNEHRTSKETNKKWPTPGRGN